jgi:hypothetical protein
MLGLSTDRTQKTVARELAKYNLDEMAVQEVRCADVGSHSVNIRESYQQLTMYDSLVIGYRI